MGTRNSAPTGVLVTTTSTGTGTYSIGASAITGYFHPSDVSPSLNGLRVGYVAVDSLTSPTIREEGEGVLTSAVPWTLSRATIRRTLSAGVAGASAINWAAGTKYIYLTPMLAQTLLLDTDGWLHTPAEFILAAAGTERARMSSSLGFRIASTVDAPGTAGFGVNNGFGVLSDGRTCISSAAGAVLNCNVNLAPGGTAALFTTQGATVGSISITASATTYNTSSDARLKRDVREMEAAEAIAAVQALQPRMGAFNVEAPDAALRPMFIADELQGVVPHAVTGQPGGETMQAAQYDPTLPLLVRALQDALARIAVLEAAA